MEGIGGFKVYKGLQRPLVFKNLKGKFIGWGAAALITSFLLCVLGIKIMMDLTVCACRESSRCPVWYGDADSQFRTVYVIHTVQTESGTPQPGFGCGLLHRTTYSPG